jgi:spore coat polysaccharide biosynthesis protein SpsF
LNKKLNEQEVFWAGSFGTEYIARNKQQEILSGNISLFTKILHKAPRLNTLIEFGANIGLNLKAINLLAPSIELTAVEINAEAVDFLKKSERVDVIHQSILDYSPSKQYDLVLIKGVLIHIDPNDLAVVYDNLYKSSSRYICICEYYNPTPVQLSYRGHSNKLFKRDFAGELLDRYKDLSLVDYGFVYHRDPVFPLDDISWFLLKKADTTIE